MRSPRHQTSGLFLVEVLRKLPPHFRDRTLHVGASDKDRKIAHIDFPLLFEVDVQCVFGDGAPGEGWPRPVDFSLHVLKQRLLELTRVHHFKVGAAAACVENQDRSANRERAGVERYLGVAFQVRVSPKALLVVAHESA